MSPSKYPANPFRPAMFSFLRDLEKNNDRDWFQANKNRYEEHIKDASLQFISDFGPHLREIAPHFQAIPKAVGGSLFRIYRDTRFSKDKTPYKTHVGIHFRHESAKGAHAPGFYLHIAPKGTFVGAGIWHPDSPTLGKIRRGLVDDPAGWKKAIGGKRFREDWELEGDSLVRPPRGFDPDHKLIEEIKRKDFIGVTRLSQKQVLAPDMPKQFAGLCRQASPLVRYLCGALEIPF